MSVGSRKIIAAADTRIDFVEKHKNEDDKTVAISECMVPFNPGCCFPSIKTRSSSTAAAQVSNFGRVDDGKFITKNINLSHLVGKKIIEEKKCVFRKAGEPDMSSGRPPSTGETVGWVWIVEGGGFFWAVHKER